MFTLFCCCVIKDFKEPEVRNCDHLYLKMGNNSKKQYRTKEFVLYPVNERSKKEGPSLKRSPSDISRTVTISKPL